MRRILLGVVALLVALILGAVLLIDRIEMAGLVAGRASAALGRPVSVGSLRIGPGGAWLPVTLRDASLGNAEGGSAPEMARVARLKVEIRVLDLLLGRPLTLRGLEVEGTTVLLEHGTGPGRDHPNWRFGPAKPPAAGPPDRRGLPLPMALALRDSVLVFRTSSGTPITMRIESGTVAAPAPDQEVRFTARGSYNDIPVEIDSTSAPVAVLRDAATPYPVALTATMGDLRLGFTGTMTDPLNVDGATGALTLAAPTMRTVLALAGTGMPMQAGFDIAGKVTRQGDAWQLTEAKGSFAGSPLTIASLALTEGGKGSPDRIAVDAALERLNLNRVLGPGTTSEAEHDADMSLALDPKPDPELQGRISIGALSYARLRATAVRLAGSLGPGAVTVDELALATSGAHVTARLVARAAGAGARIHAEAALADSDLDSMRRTVGLRPLPLGGRVDGRVVVATEGRTLNQAALDANVSAVLALRQGHIAREVIEMASTDLRLLFRTPKGDTPMRCLLAVLSMHHGVGEVAPLRIRAESGSVTGMASFDLHRRQLDAVIGSQRNTTDFWALDVPMRIWGRFDDPAIRPAEWSAEGHRKLAAAEQMAPLPPELRNFARQNPCSRPR